MYKNLMILLTVGMLVACAQDFFSEAPISTQAPPVQTSSPATSITDVEPTLVFFTSERGKFQAWVPISGYFQEFTIMRTLFSEAIDCTVFAFALNGASTMLQYCDLSVETAASLTQSAILNEARDAVDRDFHVLIDDEQEGLTDDSYLTLTLRGKTNDFNGTFKARIILVENRLYVVFMGVQAANWCNCLHQVDRVIDSFSVDPDMSIPFEPSS